MIGAIDGIGPRKTKAFFPPTVSILGFNDRAR